MLKIGESGAYRNTLWILLTMNPKDKGNLVEFSNLVAWVFVRVPAAARG